MAEMDRETRIKKGEIEEFERALRGAYADPWWRKFVETIKDRRSSFIEALVSGTMDQRGEDRCRGQISELNFILALDLYGEQEHGRREQSERNGS